MTDRRVQFDAIGTRWDIKVQDHLNDADWSATLQAIDTRIQQFDQSYSRFRGDSLVARMAAEAGTYLLPPDGYKLLDFYAQLYAATDGKVTPLIGQAMVDAGYDAEYSFQQKQLSQPPRWQDVLAFTEQSITVKQPVLLDFGAAGKGYLIDIVSQQLAAAGAREFVVNAGGDIVQRSAAGSHVDVGLENPQDTTEAIGVVRLLNRSLCASAGSKRKWGDYHHIIDPTELRSPQTIIATWVLAVDTMTADGLATALFFTDVASLRQRFDFSYALLDHDMQLFHAKDFPVTLFKAG